MPDLVEIVKSLPSVSFEEKAEILGKTLLEAEQINCPISHIFGPGVYIRQAHMPANSIVMGHYHRKPHLNIMTRGKLILVLEGKEPEEITAPYINTLPEGRKVAQVIEDSTWLNVYATDETDVEKLEEMFLDKSASPWGDTNTHLLEDKYFVEESRQDFKDAVSLLGLTEEQVYSVSTNTTDLIDFPSGEYKVAVYDSPIHGKGLFATGNFKQGEVIAPGRLDGKRTPAGRYTNHSVLPNAEAVVSENGDAYLVATRDIIGNLGGQVGEEITLDYYETFLRTR